MIIRALQTNRRVAAVAANEQLKLTKLVKIISIFLIKRMNLTAKYFQILVTKVTFEPERALECRNYLKILQVENVKLDQIQVFLIDFALQKA